MECAQCQESSYFLTGEKGLESVEEDYFNARPVEQADYEDDDCSDCSSDDEVDHETDSDFEFESSEFDTSERA